MAHYASPAITKYMRRLFDQYDQFIGENKRGEGFEFWDLVVLTASDAAQQTAFQLQVEEKISRRELPLNLPIHVISDPPGVRVGNGGSTLACLEFLEKEYGNEMFEKKILLIHAGGWSQRMPSATVMGKIFSALPHGKSPFQMLDLKLALYWPFVSKISPGIFLVCADDFLVFNLGIDDNWSVPKHGFTALAHPSNIKLGRTHGVFVLSHSESLDTSKHVQLLKCVEVLQKPNDARMKAQGALLKGDTHSFADGICMDGEIVYTDSCFYFGVDVMEKLLNFKKSVGNLNCEIDAYGDFLQAVGEKATIDYVHNTSNVSKPTANLIEMRKQVFSLLNRCDIHVLALNSSAFIHIGTTKELLHHLCRDQVFQDQMAFSKDVFNLWSDNLSIMKSEKKDSMLDKADIARIKGRPTNVSEFSCVIHSSLIKESEIENDCVVEFCHFEIPVHISSNCIISNCQMSQSDAQFETMSIPANLFLHTIPLHGVNSGIEYVTIFFQIDDNLKRTTQFKDVEYLPFLGSDIGNYLKQQGLSKEEIKPTDEILKQQNVVSDKTKGKDGEDVTCKVSLWTLKLYPASKTMTSSLEGTLAVLNANNSFKFPRLSQKLFSLEDVITMKNVKAMLKFRKNLYEKIIGH